MSLIDLEGTLSLTGTVTGDISLDSSGVGNLTSDSSDLSIVDLGIGLPVLIPISAASLSIQEDWSDPLIWPLRFVTVSGPIHVFNFVSDGSSGDYLKVASHTEDALQGAGPTAESVTFGIPITFLFGLVKQIGLTINVTYDVTIPAGADVLMGASQPVVDVYDITIAAGGTLSVAIDQLTVDTDVTNNGLLEIQSGAAATIGRDFSNTGMTIIDGALSVGADHISNSGIIEILDTYSFGVPMVFNGGGTIEAGPGAVLQISDQVIGGTITADAGGTVEVGTGGTIDKATLAGGGIFQGATAAEFSGLQDVTVGAEATYTALSGNYTTLQGGIVNSGTLATQGVGAFVIDGTATLSGGGVVALDGGNPGGIRTGAAFVFAGLPDTSDLVNIDNTISGNGIIDAPLDNRAAGIVDADTGGQTLVPYALTNRGLVEATDGGILSVVTDLDSTGGTVAALSGGMVELGSGGTIIGGVLAGGGIFQGATAAEFSGLQDVTVGAEATYTALSGNYTTLQGGIVNSGTLATQGVGAFVIDGTATLSGGGVVALDGGNPGGIRTGAAFVFAGLPDTSDLVNIDNTISGNGIIDAPLDNRAAGIVDADTGGQTLVPYALTNRGLVEATDGGILSVVTDLDSTGGTVAALSGGMVELGSGGTIIGGVLAGGGIFQGATAAEFSGLQDVTVGAEATYTALSGNYTTLQGGIVNSGTLATQGVGAFVIDGTATLSGGGVVALDGGNPGGIRTGAAFVFAGLPDTSDLVNIDNTISGNGIIDAPLDNRAAGIVDADTGGQTLVPYALTNRGLVEATDGGILSVVTDLDSTGGTVAALSGGMVELGSGGTIIGGVLAGGGIFQGATAAEFSGLQDVTVDADTTYTAPSSNLSTLQGSIVNSGTLATQETGTFVIDGTATLSGGGVVALDSGGNSDGIRTGAAFAFAGLPGTSDLVNVDNTISGNGFIDAPLDNRAGGIVDANTTGKMLSLSGPESNAGLFEAEAGGILQVGASVDNNGGTVEALASSTIEVVGGTINGGTIIADVGGTVEVGTGGTIDKATLAGGGIFQGATAAEFSGLQDVTVDADTTYTALSGNYTTLQGDIVNSGTLATQGVGAFVIDGTATLSGGGVVALDSGGNSDGIRTGAAFAFAGLPGTSDLVNIDNTISGNGFIDAPLDNRAGGIVDADTAGQTLSLSALTNRGLVEATDGGILSVVTDLDSTGGTVAALSGGTVEIGSGGTIIGGVLAGGGIFQGATAAEFSGLQDVTVDADTTYTAPSSNLSTLQGSIVNSGTLATQETGTFVIDGTATLSGGGVVALDSGGNSDRIRTGAAFAFAGLPGTSDLVNVDNTISGNGFIDAPLDNRAGGIVDANTAGQSLSLSEPESNAGLFEADAGGVLQVGASVDNTGGMVEALSGGTIEVTSSTINGGTIIASTGTVQIDAAGTIADATLTASAGGTILDNGVIEATAGHTLVANADITGTGTMLVAGTMELDGAVAPGISLVFDPGTLILGAPLTMNATIGDFTDDDTISLAGTYASLTDSFAAGTLTVLGNGAKIAALTFTGAYAPSDFSLSQTGGVVTVSTDIPCFAAGTSILTQRGEVAVEALRVGDLVLTRDGTPQPITWIGHRHVDMTHHPRPEQAQPFRILHDAFADHQPARDLYLSPDHAVFIYDVLIPVKCLDNGRTITQTRVPAIDYYHVELARHDVLLAETLPVESYLDTGNRAMFANAGVVMLLHPEFAISRGLKAWTTDACAELVTGGPILRAARQALAARADTLVRRIPDRPGLRLSAGGQDIAPCAATRTRAVFVLPPGTREFRILSPTWMPIDVTAGSDDSRVLGVAITRIILRDGVEQRCLAPDDPALVDGWHAIERSVHAMWRWTRGDARVRLPADCHAPVVEIELRSSIVRAAPAAIRCRRQHRHPMRVERSISLARASASLNTAGTQASRFRELAVQRDQLGSGSDGRRSITRGGPGQAG